MGKARLIDWLHQRTSLLLTNPQFLRLWLGQSISVLGDWVGFTALTLHVYNITGSASALAILTIVRSLPILLFGPMAGVMVDRFSRRQIMLLSDVARALLFALLPFTTTFSQMVVITFLTAAISTFFNPALMALTPDLVEKKQLIKANSALFSASNLMMIVGPALGGFIVGFGGAHQAFWFDAITFLASSLAIFFITEKWPKGDTTQKKQVKATWFRDLALGLSYIIRQQAILVMTIEMMIMALGLVSITVLEVIFVKSVLGAGDQGYGILLSVAGIGALIGSLTAGWLSKKASASFLFCWTGVLGGLTFFLYANIPYFPVTLGIVFVQTSIFSLGQVVAQGLMQQLVPEDLRGRVFSLIISGHTVIRVLGVAAWGTLIDYIGVIPIFNLAGSVATLAGLFILVNMTHLQTAEDQALTRVTADSPVAVKSA